MKPIKISTGKISLPAELDDSPTAKLIYEALPIEGNARRWGDEIYFSMLKDALAWMRRLSIAHLPHCSLPV